MIYNILYKTMIGARPLRVIFDKVDGFIRNYDGTKYLVLFDHERCNAIYDRIWYIVGLESGCPYTCAKIKINSNDDFPLEETLNLHNVVILIKSVLNKNKKRYYFNIF